MPYKLDKPGHLSEPQFPYHNSGTRTLPPSEVVAKVKRNIEGGNTVKCKALKNELDKTRNQSCFKIYPPNSLILLPSRIPIESEWACDCFIQ